MAHERTYTYSQLAASSVGQFVTLHYDFVGPLRSKFYVLGLHDNYLIETADEKYILRLYRNDWCSAEDVHFELELLAHLGAKNAPVACPVRTLSGALCFRIDSPEGERMAALFRYADGRVPEDAMSIDDCALLGRTVAYVHRIADTFTTHYTRPAFDVHYLLDDSRLAIRPFLDSDAQWYLDELHVRLLNAWPVIPKDTGAFGICLGDVNAKNFHIDGERNITLFDFDQCGYGFRAFEIGKFASSIHSHKTKQAMLGAFLQGYQRERSLSRAEYDAIPYFELVAVLWVMAIHAKNANRIGYKFLEKPYWDRKLAILQELEDGLGYR